MNDDTLKEVATLAGRFSELCQTLEDVWGYDPVLSKSITVKGRSEMLNTSIRRMSMDLTRLLARLRSNK